MVTRTVTCGDCGAAVPYGRLSCVACGGLLASVAGAVTRTPPRGPASPRTPSRSRRASRPAPPVPEPEVAAALEPEMTAAPEPETTAAPAPQMTAAPAPEPPFRSQAERTREPAPPLVPEWTPEPPTEHRRELPFGAIVASPLRPAAALPAGVPVAGAYLPPSAMFAVETDDPAGRGRSITPPNGAGTGGSSSRGLRLPTPGRVGLFADLPLDAPNDLPGWLVAAGCGATVIGFVLPWGDNGMIGGGVDPGFFSRWGLANAANLVPLLVVLAALWLQLGPTVSPSTIRTGAVGLLLGGAILGLAFVYATSPFELGTGGVLVGLGGALLVAGGAIALRAVALAGRHASGEPGV